jgi:multicomponent Na+:H+ antiporter subunit B
MKHALSIVAIVLVGLVLFVALGAPQPAATPLRDRLIAEGVETTGAVNIVSAIYLAFRAFDTLGETIVLLLAVSGVIFFVKDDESRGEDR